MFSFFGQILLSRQITEFNSGVDINNLPGGVLVEPGIHRLHSGFLGKQYLYHPDFLKMRRYRVDIFPAGMVIMFLLAFLPLANKGQKKLLNARELDEKFSQVWNESEASRKNYTWKSRTEVTRDNKVMQVLIEENTFDLNGRPVQKVISNQEAALPSVLLIRRIAEEQKSKIVTFMSDLRIFLEKHALTDDSIRHTFFSTATITSPDARGQLMVTGFNIFTKGDILKWWIDTRSYTITYATISTIFKGISVDFSATYYLLPGLNYMSQARIRVPSKGITISLKFYDFKKQ